MQLVYMIFAARMLGAELTGLLFLIVSVALITSSFVGLGGGGLVMRDVSRDHNSAALALGRAISMSLATFPILFPVVLLAAHVVTKGAVPLWVIALIGVSDLLAARLLTTCWSYFIAREQQVKASALILSLPLFRLIGVTATAYWPEDARLMVFSMIYAGVSFAVLAGALIYTISISGRPKMGLRGIDHRSGVSFSLTWLNQALQTEADKIILGLFGTPALVAVYGVASRLMDDAAMPPRALRVTLQSQLFRDGASGHMGPFQTTLKILPVVIVYGIVIWVIFALIASPLSSIFGPEFEILARILPFFAALPLLRAIADYGAEIFMASDRPSVQAITQTFATVLRISFGIILISAFSLEGAILTALSVNAIAACILWGLAWKLSRE